MNDWKKISAILIAAAILIGAVYYYFGDGNEDGFSEADALEAERGARPMQPPQPSVAEQGGGSPRADVEAEMGRPFTEEEAALKPPEVPWHAWAYSIEVHKISAAKNGRVEFFGKVVSEDGEPLSGVNLVAEVAGSEPSFVKALATGDETYVRSIELTTDQDGKFEITDFVGRRLTVKDFEKPGYVILGEKKFKGVAAKKSWSYSFIANSPSSFRGDPENPEVFTMKKVE